MTRCKLGESRGVLILVVLVALWAVVMTLTPMLLADRGPLTNLELIGVISAFLWVGVAIFSVVKMTKALDKSTRFANALEKLPLLLSDGYSNSVEILCDFDKRTLEERAKKTTVRKVHTLLVAERQAKENTGWALQEKLDGRVACLRQELKNTHAALLAFQLVDEKWDQYFEKAQTELITAEESAAATGDPPSKSESPTDNVYPLPV